MDTRGLLQGAGIGAALMYALDPDRGRRRRLLARDKAKSWVNRAGKFVAAGVRDGRHRARKLVPRPGGGSPESEILIDRVRASLGHATDHAHAIEVAADGDGRVTLSGFVLAADAAHVVR